MTLESRNSPLLGKGLVSSFRDKGYAGISQRVATGLQEFLQEFNEYAVWRRGRVPAP
jgi:hypothetical protein